MKKDIRTVIISLLIMCVCVASAQAGGVGTSGANYLKIDAGARSAALGSAYVGLANDINALYFNPAGLVAIPHAAVDTMQLNWLADITQQQIAGVIPVEGWGVFGGYYSSLATPYDKETKYDSAYGYASTGDQFNSEVKVIDVAYAFSINKELSAGLGVKTIEERLADVKKTGMAADVGLLYRGFFFKELSVGAVVQNISVSPLRTDEPLPQTIVIGMAYTMSLFETQRLTFLSDVGIPNDGVTALGVGVEYALNRYIAFRVGYKDKVGFTLGGGLSFGNLNLNYAYVPYGELGNSYRIAVGYDFDTVDTEGTVETPVEPVKEMTKEELFKEEKKAAPAVKPAATAVEKKIETPAADNKSLFEEAKPVETEKKVETPAPKAVEAVPTVSAGFDGLFDQ